MECLRCKCFPEFHCKTHDTFLCSQHLSDYLKIGEHENSYMSSQLEYKELETLQKNLKTLVLSLKKIKKTQKDEFIRQIEEIQSNYYQSLKHLKKMIYFYENFARQNQFPQSYSARIKALKCVKIEKLPDQLTIAGIFTMASKEKYYCKGCQQYYIECSLSCGHRGCFHCLKDHDPEECGNLQAKCEYCPSTQNLYNYEGKVICYSCYLTMMQCTCENCSQKGYYCLLQCNHNGCNLCYNQVCKKCYQSKQLYQSVKTCSSCSQTASLTTLECLHEVCQSCTKNCKACKIKLLEQQKKGEAKEEIKNYKEEKYCMNCGMFGFPFKLDCKHMGCVYCSNDTMCKSCAFKKQSCINCERIIQFKYEFECGHVPCNNCVKGTCKICNFLKKSKTCSRCEEKKFICKIIGNKDCDHDSCLNCLEISNPCIKCFAISRRRSTSLQKPYYSLKKDENVESFLSPNYQTFNELMNLKLRNNRK